MLMLTSLLGWLVLILGILCLLGTIVGFIVDRGDRILRRWESSIRRETTHDIGNDLLGNAWWFSEWPDVHEAIKLLGESLTGRSGSLRSIDQIRDKWCKSHDAREAGKTSNPGADSAD